MKRRSQKLPAVTPLLVSAQQESGPEPRLEVEVLVRLRDEAVAAQNGLSIFGVIKPNLKIIILQSSEEQWVMGVADYG